MIRLNQLKKIQKDDKDTYGKDDKDTKKMIKVNEWR